ncbi:MAG: hypothetical protein DRN92_02605 [Thermoproteota archaeon]|nr:MAG: hypothetical protein DRN92_02605 [Candidatus Korarchaeota archaeon]
MKVDKRRKEVVIRRGKEYIALRNSKGRFRRFRMPKTKKTTKEVQLIKKIIEKRLEEARNEIKAAREAGLFHLKTFYMGAEHALDIVLKDISKEFGWKEVDKDG